MSDGRHPRDSRQAREPVFRGLELVATGLVRGQKLDLRFAGLANIPRAGGAVLAINHTAYLDFLPAAYGVYQSGRRTRFMIKSEVMGNVIMRFLVNHTKTIPVDRSAGADAYRAAVAELADGEIVAVYPEATISRSFELKEFKTGAVRMAAAAGVPLIPTIVWGAQRQWTKGVRPDMGRSGITIEVRYGEPVEMAVDADVEDATVRLRTQMNTMLSEVQRSYPHPAGARWVPARLGGGAPTPEEAQVIENDEAARKAAARAAKADRDRKGRR